VLKCVLGDFPFSPFPPHQDECLAVFACCHSFITKEIRPRVKRVALCDKQIFKKEILKHEIRNRTKWNWKICKQQKHVAYYIRYMRNKKRFSEWKGQVICYYFPCNLLFHVRMPAACNVQNFLIRCAAYLIFWHTSCYCLWS
jgi:hypothetical protein